MGSKRGKAMKRKVAQANWHLDESLFRVKELHEAFEPVHPLEAKVLETVAQAVILAQDMIREFWANCWNSNPDSMESYLGKKLPPY